MFAGERRAKRKNKNAIDPLKKVETWDGTEAADDRIIQAFKRTGAGGHYPAILSSLLESLRSNNIVFLAPPYEADGQLAFSFGLSGLAIVTPHPSIKP